MQDDRSRGMHFDDIEWLLRVLERLVEAGNTVIVIKHNLEDVKSADWIIDLGPGAGEAGGPVIAEGTPEDVAENVQSLTGSFLKRLFLIDAARAYARQPSERAA